MSRSNALGSRVSSPSQMAPAATGNERIRSSRNISSCRASIYIVTTANTTTGVTRKLLPLHQTLMSLDPQRGSCTILTTYPKSSSRYLRETISITMKGFKTLDCLISAPHFQDKITLHQWPLTIQMVKGSRQLFSSIDVDPSNVYYFCCNKGNCSKAIQWLDNLPGLLHSSFPFEGQYLICDSEYDNPSRSYRAEPVGNTEDDICGFKQILNGIMDT
eukprot:7208571-Ditylum_brightwellii.AAC.1